MDTFSRWFLLQQFFFKIMAPYAVGFGMFVTKYQRLNL